MKLKPGLQEYPIVSQMCLSRSPERTRWFLKGPYDSMINENYILLGLFPACLILLVLHNLQTLGRHFSCNFCMVWGKQIQLDSSLLLNQWINLLQFHTDVRQLWGERWAMCHPINEWLGDRGLITYFWVIRKEQNCCKIFLAWLITRFAFFPSYHHND